MKIRTKIKKFMPQMSYFLAGMMAIFLAVFAVPDPALASFNPENAGNTILNLFKIILVIAAAAIAVVSLMRSAIVPAIVAVLAAGFIYVMLTPNMLSALGQGIANWLGIS